MIGIQSLVEDFTAQLAALIERDTLARVRQAVESALGGGRPGQTAKVSSITLGAKPRKKAPKQLCPVPGCKNPAAPVFGMVCAEHKGIAKAKIKKYREARRAEKLGAKAKSAPKKTKAKARKRPAPKKAKAKAKKKPAPASKVSKAVKKKPTKKAAPKKSVPRRKPAKRRTPKAAASKARPAAPAPTTPTPAATA